MSGYHLAQLNIAALLAPLDSPQLADFVANLEPVNTLAEQSPGFVWRLQDEEGDATSFRPFGDDVIVNMSVWRDVAALQAFAYRSGHSEFVRRRREWFEKASEAIFVLWWVPEGHEPNLTEAAERLALLRKLGPSPEAFTFREAFSAPTVAANAPLETPSTSTEIILDRQCGRETFPITGATWNVAHDDDLDSPALCVRIRAASGPVINPYDADEVLHTQPHWEITLRAPGLVDGTPAQGQRFDLESGYDEETDGYVTNFYYFDHEQTDANVIEILEVDGRRLRIRLSGQRFDSSAANTPIDLMVEAWFEHDPQARRSSS